MGEITKEMEANLKEMENLIRKQEFKVVDAQKYLERYFNIYQRMMELEVSRDLWKGKFKALKEVVDKHTKKQNESKKSS